MADKRIKDMLKELVRLGPKGDYATRSCCLNRARNLLAEIDGMEVVGWKSVDSYGDGDIVGVDGEIGRIGSIKRIS